MPSLPIFARALAHTTTTPHQEQHSLRFFFAMDASTDAHLTQGDTSQDTSVECFTVDNELGPGDIMLDDAAPDASRWHPSDMHPSLVTAGDSIAAHEGQSSTHLFKSDQEPSDTQTAGKKIDYGNDRATPHSNSHQDIPPISEEVLSLDRAVVPSGGPASVIFLETHAIVHPLESLLLPTFFPVVSSRDEKEPDLEQRSNCIQMLHTASDPTRNTRFGRLADEETQEDSDNPCDNDNIPSSLPPSSSPPQLFSSSPCVSSQSSANDVEPTKEVSAVKMESSASSRDYPHGSQVQSSHALDEPCLESKDFRCDDIVDVATLSRTDTCNSDTLPASCTSHDLGPSKQRMAYNPDGSRPIKRPKLDPGHYLPPMPKRTTLVSQNRQFKKLSAPFRPPLKVPLVVDGLTRSEAEPTPRSGDNMRSEPRGSTIHPSLLQNKALNTPKSVSQFKSPLVNRVLPADARTIRLTPAVQTLERKLQLLKRAVKVEEDKEEEVLARLAEKWIEAGREVACDVWDATKDTGDFEGKATSIRRPYGWKSTDNENVSWGWDTKRENPREESDPSEVPYTTGRPAPEEDEGGIGYNTLGTMLRQLGIAPEIFGWDDDKEAFSD